MVSFELEIEKDVFSSLWGIEPQTFGFRAPIQNFFFVPVRRKTSFSISLPSSKLTIFLSYSITKYDAIDIADPSSMQDACYMNFVIDLAHCRVSVAQW